MSNTEAGIREMLDEHLIRKVLSRYWRGVDRRDVEMIISAFHPDAVDHHAGKDNLAHDFARAAMERMPQLSPGGTQHRVANISIEVDGDRAWGEAYYHAIHNAENQINELFGRYIDRFERRDGEWKIAERWAVLDFTQTSPRAPHPAENNPATLRGRHDKTDLSYRRDA